MKILIIGDIVGSCGRDALMNYLPKVRKKYDFIIVNGENSAAGKGITPKIADEFFEAGVDVITGGNHIWDKKEIYSYLENSDRLLRPANYPPHTIGVGHCVKETKNKKKIAVISLQGRVFMNDLLDCPFRTGLEIIDKLKKQTRFIIVDFHAEASSEKISLGRYLDGKISFLFGTHTHVQTADEKILPEGTGYITDVGMTGSDNGVIGMEAEGVIPRFVTALPGKFEPAEGNVRLNGVSVELCDETAECIKIERINIGDADLNY
ncbi:MAG: TIGR00282 family metallophosphoesterase [Fusobacteriaceae bacterium]